VVVTGEAPPPADELEARSKALQDKHGFRFPLPALLARRIDKERTTHVGEMLTDDFAPVNLYDTIGDKKRKK
jgi:hypothetical protein